MKAPQLHLLYTDAAILAEAMISDQPEIMRLHELPDRHQALIESGRLKGGQPVSVRWPGGQFAILFCEPGSDLPSMANVLRAYRACLNTYKQFPKGDTL